MNIYELLGSKENIACLSRVQNCNSMFFSIIPPIVDLNGSGKISREDVIEEIEKREKMGSTCIGKGVAIPHIKIGGLKEMIAKLVIIKDGVEYNAVDKELCNIFFLLIGGDDTISYLRILGQLSKLLTKSVLVSELRRASSPSHAFSIIEKAERG